MRLLAKLLGPQERMIGRNYAAPLGAYMTAIGFYLGQTPLTEYGLTGVIIGLIWIAGQQLLKIILDKLVILATL